MGKIIYSDQFYVNDFPNKGHEYAKQFVEAFMNKPPQQLFDFLAKKHQFGKLNPEFQAVIIGEPKTSLFGKPQAAIVLVHSNFIAYSTNPNFDSPVGINYGYATFDNEISIDLNGNQLELRMPYETILIGVDSNSIKEDFQIIKELIEKNISSIELFHEVLPRREETSFQSSGKETILPEPFVSGVPQVPSEIEGGPVLLTEEEMSDSSTPDDELNLSAEEIDETVKDEAPHEMTEVEESEPLEIEEELTEVDEPELIEVDEPDLNEIDELDMTEAEFTEVDEDSSEEWGHIMMEENTNGEYEEVDHTLVEQEERQPVVQDVNKSYDRNRQSIDPRFRTKQPIISNDSIPEGFVYAEPVIFVNSVRPGFFKSSTAKNAYLKAYNACLEEAVNEINEGRFDAVFNLQVTTQSVENYYDVVVTGDAVVYDNH